MNEPFASSTLLNSNRIIIAGGGAAGFFAGITCAEANPRARITILEKSPHFLTKVRISGGGRCNVTHACFDPRELVTRYPRGERALIAPFLKFAVPETIAWFERRGLKLKTETDGRMFPVTDSSETVIDCLLQAATRAGIELVSNQGVDQVARQPDGSFMVTTKGAASRPSDAILLATGGCRSEALGQVAVSLGHSLVTPVPSLFTFHIQSDWLRELAGVSVESVQITVLNTELRERGPILLTHWGLSGPVVLRTSAWGARTLNQLNYHFTVGINWVPHLTPDSLLTTWQRCRTSNPAKLVANTPLPGIPARLWRRLVLLAGIEPLTRWATLTRAAQHRLGQQLIRTELEVTGKSLNKDEFVTCGGVPLAEVNFKTMESRRCPGLYFAGELLDLDGITGGYNFQAAWTTGWIAGHALAARGNI